MNVCVFLKLSPNFLHVIPSNMGNFLYCLKHSSVSLICYIICFIHYKKHIPFSIQFYYLALHSLIFLLPFIYFIHKGQTRRNVNYKMISIKLIFEYIHKIILMEKTHLGIDSSLHFFS